MNDTPASSSLGWEISARRNGDVLAARARGDGIELMLLSRSAGHNPAQIEAWLAELIGVAVETSRNDPGDRPISALLRHALTGLLFSHAELWHHTPDDPPCSVAFVTTQDRVAFGWAGPAETNIWVDDQPSEGPVIRVRDPDGREAQVVEVESWRRVRVGLTWRAGAAPAAPAAVEVHAEWAGRAALQGEPARSAETPGAIPEWRTPSWLGQKAPWEESTPAAPAPEPVAALPEVPPQPFQPPVTAAPPVLESVPELPAPPATVQQMTLAERAAELAPDEPAAPEPVAALPEVPAQPLQPPVTAAPPVVKPVREIPAPPATVQQMTMAERAVELAPDEPASPVPASPVPVPSEPAVAGPAESTPLEIIRAFGPSAPVPPQAGMEIIRTPEPVEHRVTPAVPVSPAPPVTSAAPPAEPDPLMSALAAWNPTTPAAPPAPASPGAVPPEEADPALTAWASRTAPGRAYASPGASRHASRARRPAWPSESEPSREWWQRRTPIGIAVLALFAVGWLLGGFGGGHHGGPGTSPMARALARFGLGPAHYQVAVDSHPQGAWIALDGRDVARRTPATIEVEPGTHAISLSFTDLGHAVYEVHGERNSHVALDATLWGSLAVSSMDNSVAVKVTVDGTTRGLAPVTIDSLAPGVHQVQFWSPGAGSWEQIVEVRVREAAEVVARPFASPSTGLLEVRATLNADGASQSVPGALVWLDGERRGVTPLKLELARGPHSVRISWRGQDSPVQVIDLPGGNQRFASFDVGGEVDLPRLRALLPGRLSADTPTLVSGALEGLSAADVREMWLHVSTPEGQWRRYAMNVLKAPGGAVGASVFPIAQLDTHGRARFYVSVSARSGDELFSEIQTALGPASANAASAR